MTKLARAIIVFILTGVFVFLPYYVTLLLADKDSEAMSDGIIKSWLFGWAFIAIGLLSGLVLYVLAVLFIAAIKWVITGKWYFHP